MLTVTVFPINLLPNHRFFRKVTLADGNELQYY